MNTILSIIFAAGVTVMTLPFIFRYLATSRIQKRLVKVADSMRTRAQLEGCLSDDSFVCLHDMVLLSAAYAPLASAGLAEPVQVESEPDVKLTAFLDRNGWLLPFLAAHHFSVQSLLFFGRPWNARGYVKTLFSALALGMA